MGRLRRELSDPWGVLLAGVVGGCAAVVGGGALIGAGVAAAVYGVKVAAGALLGDDDSPAPLPALERPRPGTAGAFWLGRAEAAVRSLHDMARGSGPSPTAQACAHAAAESEQVLQAMRVTADQAVAVSAALVRSDGPQLEDELAHLRSALDRSPDDASLQRSVASVTDRIAVRDRLRRAQDDLDGRLQSSALGLEGLVAHVAELRATAATSGVLDPSSEDLARLTSEVAGLRAGLADVEQVAQRALGSQSG